MEDKRTSQQGLSTTGWISIIGVALIIFVLVAMRNNMIRLPNSTDRDNVLGVSQEEKTLDRITENPTDFVGQTVNVEGKVDNVYTSRTFVINAPGLVNDEMLVIVKNPYDMKQMQQQDEMLDGKVKVTGVVKQFQAVEAMNSLDRDLDLNSVNTYEGQPYIYADSISFVQ